ncbi:DUF6415 family natural product biosynthesis protein [Streptomyces sp. NPDC056534]|uniref:DUF6415 family natural product biosynthesis protein n=1 Tax=Streptomyces sp. NPDC056534 TaxID=3345857 RepID=UPI0036BB112E
MNATAHGAAEQVPEQTIPLDLQTMRETAQRALGEGADDPPMDAVESLIELLQNGHDRVTAVYVGAGCCRSSEAGQSRRAVHPLESRLKKLIQALRGMLFLILPEVTAAAGRYPKGDMPRVCALVGIEEAWRRIRTRHVPATSPWALRQAQRLARSVMALTDHYVNLGGPDSANLGGQA